MKIGRLTKEPRAAFNLHVQDDRLTLDGVKELDQRRSGSIKHKDVGGLPDAFEVFHVGLQHGLSGISSVYVTRTAGE